VSLAATMITLHSVTHALMQQCDSLQLDNTSQNPCIVDKCFAWQTQFLLLCQYNQL
jgi:hypothetical protein